MVIGDCLQAVPQLQLQLLPRLPDLLLLPLQLQVGMSYDSELLFAPLDPMDQVLTYIPAKRLLACPAYSWQLWQILLQAFAPAVLKVIVPHVQRLPFISAPECRTTLIDV